MDLLLIIQIIIVGLYENKRFYKNSYYGMADCFNVAGV